MLINLWDSQTVLIHPWNNQYSLHREYVYVIFSLYIFVHISIMQQLNALISIDNCRRNMLCFISKVVVSEATCYLCACMSHFNQHINKCSSTHEASKLVTPLRLISLLPCPADQFSSALKSVHWNHTLTVSEQPVRQDMVA